MNDEDHNHMYSTKRGQDIIIFIVVVILRRIVKPINAVVLVQKFGVYFIAAVVLEVKQRVKL